MSGDSPFGGGWPMQPQQPPSLDAFQNAGGFDNVDPSALFGGDPGAFQNAFFHQNSSESPAAAPSTTSASVASPHSDDEAHKAASSVGPHRNKTAGHASGDSKKPIAAPVKAACTFCRSRKSRCNGQQPCATCVNRGRVDDCFYTVSRRGGKPKPKPSAPSNPFEGHLESLFRLSELPETVRVPGAVPSLLPFQTPALLGMDGNAGLSSGATMDLSQYATLLSGLQSAQGLGNDATTSGFSAPATWPQLQEGQTQAQQSPAEAQQQSFSPQLASQMAASAQVPSERLETPEARRAALHDYYRYLYRFIPVFLRPEYAEQAASSMRADSPLLLSLQALLPMLRDHQPSQADPAGFGGPGTAPSFVSQEKRLKLREVTATFERQATQAIEEALEDEEGSSQASDPSDTRTLEIIQALCVLTIYEYGSGRALKARLKADQALGLAMTKGYHHLAHPTQPSGVASASPSSASNTNQSQSIYVGVPDSEIFEMKKRTWWTIWSLVLWASYNTGHIPTIRADDPRVRSEMPSCRDGNAWRSNIASLQALLLVQDRVLALSHLERNEEAESNNDSEDGDDDAMHGPDGKESLPSNPFAGMGSATRRDAIGGSQELPSSITQPPTMANRDAILRSMMDIDASLQQQIAHYEASGGLAAHIRGSAKSVSLANGALDQDEIEKQLVDYLHTSAAIQLYTASLTLHIGQAFQGASLFERKLCFLSSVKDSSSDQVACQTPMPDAFANMASGDQLQWNGASGGGLQQAPTATMRDLYARGPFLPQLSLQRCVNASEKLLEISRQKDEHPSPNPFNCCSFVLISFVCLMQALATSGGMQPATGDNVAGASLLRSAQDAAALDNGSSAATAQLGQGEEQGRASRLQRLQRIWQRVNEARTTLAGLAENWRIAQPMYEEVTVCLAASQQLLAGQAQ